MHDLHWLTIDKNEIDFRVRYAHRLDDAFDVAPENLKKLALKVLPTALIDSASEFHEESIMSRAAVALPPHPVDGTQKQKTNARAAVETASHVSGIIGMADAGTHLGKVVDVVDKAISTGGRKAAGVATKFGWKKLAAFCLKLAAASPLVAKIIVGVAVVAVAVCIFQVVRGA